MNFLLNDILNFLDLLIKYNHTFSLFLLLQQKVTFINYFHSYILDIDLANDALLYILIDNRLNFEGET